MSIFALPSSTTHLLRSSSTIADPLSLVKELVDNSIDAGATSIEITIASNTVDRVQVRDNGCGIQLEDYGSLGRRSHTSKLRNFDELHLKGGKTLGFRGEALAGANCLATIKITTRTAQDPVASLLQLKRGSGGISSQKPISGTVGTTVQAVNLFENIPVRRQNAIKVSRKMLTDIRRLLESYVIALPHVKLSLKVPGSPSQTWIYSPCSLPNTRDAITQVFGHTLNAQLVELSSDLSEEGPAEAQLQNLKMTMILPRPGGDVKAIKGRGAFISVDSRPLSHLRGTGKKLFSIFKTSLSKVSTSSDNSRAPSSPFMQLSIQCPPGSYDPNISPLKDEVLFLNEPDILSCFQTLCDTVYNKEALTTRKSQNQPVSVENSQSPGMGVSSVGESTPINGTYLNETESECLTTDQELLDSLSDGLERLLGGNSGAFGSGERSSPSAVTFLTPPKNNARPEYWHQTKSVKEAHTIKTLMRTRLKVNLSRKESDSTDLDDTEGLLPVQVVPRKASSPAKTPSQSHSRGRTLASSRRFENIGDYFLPVRDELVEIATDETATPDNTQPDNDFPSHDETHRLPLKELTESDLNTFREEEEDEGSDQESVIELSFVEPNVAPSPRTSPRRMAGSLAPNNPFRQLTRPRQVPNPDFQLVNLRTPPSSDPTRPDSLITRDSRRHSTTNSSTRGQRSSRGNVMPSANRRGDHGLRQNRLLLGSGPTVSQNRRRSEQARHGNGLASRRSTLTPSREDTSAHLKDMHQNTLSQDFVQPVFSFQGPASTNPHRGVVGGHELAQNQDSTQWSHSLQTLLMRTPPLQATRLDEQTLGEHCQALDQIPDDYDHAFASRPTKRQRRCSSVATSQGEESDPRCLLMKRQRIFTEGGRLKRIASKKLPFETIPQDDFTMKLSIKASIQMDELDAVVVEFMTSSRAAEQDLPIQFKNMEEVDKVDKLLKLTVEPWLNENPSIEVEYTLRSEAKGKSKA
ncbi:hypothetical protein ACHAPA_001813 [Fusarium lateritium]